MSGQTDTSSVQLAFILGTGRCGSTLLHEWLSYHPDIGFISNIDNRFPRIRLKGRHNNYLYRRGPSPFTGRMERKRDSSPGGERIARMAQRLSLKIAPSEAYRILASEVSPMLVDPVHDLTKADYTPRIGERLRRFFVERGEAQGKRVLLHKFTGWPRAGLLIETFAEARFIHVIRDGRAVANSLVQQPWWRGYRGPSRWGWGPLPSTYEEEWKASGQSFVMLAGIEWKMLMDAFEAARKSVPAEQWMELRYEDFLKRPQEVCREVFDFLGLDWNDEVKAALEGLAIRPERQAAYRRELTPDQVEALEKCLGLHLKNLGYSVA